MLVSPAETKQLMDDRAEMEFLGRHRRKAILQVEAHLVAKHAQRAHAGAVFLAHAIVPHVPQQIKIWNHQEISSLGMWPASIAQSHGRSPQ